MRRLFLALLLASFPSFAQIAGWSSGQQIETGGSQPTVTLTSCATNSAWFIAVLVTDGSGGYDATKPIISSTNISAAQWHHGSNNVVSNAQSALWWAYSTSVSNSEAVTATGSYVYKTSLTAQCFSGVAASSTFDQANLTDCGDGENHISTCQPGSVTPTQGNELLVAGAFSVAVTSITSGWTSSVTLGSTPTMIYLVQTTPAAANPNFNFALGYPNVGAEIMTFRAASPTLDYSVSGPSTGYDDNASSTFTVTISSGTFNGSKTVTISDGSQGGTITPSVGSSGTSSVTVTPANGSTSFTFTYTAVVTGALTLTFTGSGMAGSNPDPVAYTSNPLTYTNSCGAGSGLVGAASSTCTVTLSGTTFDGTKSITLTDSSEYVGGTFTPSVGNPFVSSGTVAPSSGSSFTYTYTPAGPVGLRIITAANNFQATNPSNVNYTATSGDVCTFTAKATGNWNAAGTWTPSGCTGGGHTTPTTGDTVTITGYTVTCSTGTCYVGTGPANNTTYDLTVAQGAAADGVIEIASGVTLWLTGNFKLNSSGGSSPTHFAILKMDTGSTFIHDNANQAVSYRGVGGASINWNNIKIGALGDTCTTGSSFSYSCATKYLGIDFAGGVYPVLFSSNSLYDNLTYQVYGANFKYCGTASLPCFGYASNNNANGYANAGIVDFENDVFDTTGLIGTVGSYTATAVTALTWKNNREINDVTGWLNANPGHMLVTTPGSCVVSGNYFDQMTNTIMSDYLQGCLITGNVFSSGFNANYSVSHPVGSFTNNFHILPIGSNLTPAMYVPIVNNVYYQVTSGQTSAHMGFFFNTYSPYTQIGNIGDRSSTVATEAHCGSGSDTSGATAIFLDNLAVMTSTGDPGCEWWSANMVFASHLGPVSYMDHNGENGLSFDTWFGMVGHSGYYYPTNAVVAAFRGNIGWSPTTGSSNYQFWDVQLAGTTPTTLVNASTIVDWNDNYNGTASTLFNATTSPQASCEPSTFNGTPYQLCSNTASPGSHETTVDPKYVDTTRRVDTWAYRVMGQAQSITGAKQAMWQCADIRACIDNMRTWIRQGWQPTNMALKGSAHDGKIIGFSGTYGSGYSGTCGVTITPQDAWDLGGTIPAHAASATCTFSGGVPQIALVSGGAHYRIATPATVAITCGGCTPTVAASLTPIIQPSDIGPVPMVVLPSAF